MSFNIEYLEEYYNKAMPFWISDLSFASLYAWSDILNVNYKNISNDIGLLELDDVHHKCKCLIGRYTKTDIENFVNNECNGDTIKFSYVEDNKLKYFESIDGYNIKVEYDAKHSDYIYDFKKFTTLKQRKKEEYNYYINHNNCKFVRMNGANTDLCKEITQSWCDLYCCDNCVFGCEKQAVIKMIGEYDRLNLIGGFIFEDNTPVAFAIAELIGNIMFCHFQKSSAKKKGQTIYLYYNLFEHFAERAKFINFCEDLGLEGLKKFKMRLKPVKMIHKYSIILNRI